MRVKCRPVKLKEEKNCRLCGQSVTEGYMLKGPVRGYTCRACYQRFYGPLISKTAFHPEDVITREFWQPFCIEDDVVMLPALSVTAMKRFVHIMYRVLPVLLILAAAASGTDGEILKQIPGRLGQLMTGLWVLAVSAVSHFLLAMGRFSMVFGHLPGVFGHLWQALKIFAAGIAQMAVGLVQWIGGFL